MNKPNLLSPWALAALWFGAAVSMAEILTGGLLAGMPNATAWIAIIVGHIVGGLIFWAVARLSWKSDRGAIAVCTDAFGRWGASLFGGLNVLQLLGWTVVMLIAGGDSMNQLAVGLGLHVAPWLWRLVLGGVLALWLIGGFRHDSFLTKVASILLLLLTVAVAALLWGGNPGFSAGAAVVAASPPPLDFGSALELVVVMPLSWLPLVGDYTRPSKARKWACVAAAVAYGLGGTWMYLTGFATASHTGNADPTAGLMAIAGIGGALIGLFIVVLSTVTTAVLDVASAGSSARTVVPRLRETPTALAVVGVGTLLAILVPLDRYQNFLYAIGSVFAPLYAVLLVQTINGRWQAGWGMALRGSLSFVAWGLGLILYYLLLPGETPLGVSIPVMAAVAVLHSLLVLGVLGWKRLRISAA